jgi:hypothetical protein
VSPEFLTLTPEQIGEIRSEKGVKIVIEWLEWERERAKDLVLATTVAGHGPAAILRAGSAVTFEHILRALNTPKAIAEMDDEEFKDPARRPSRKD